MAKTPERAVKDKVVKVLKAHDVYYFSPIGGAYSVKGVPDIICCVNGTFVGIEVKAGKNTTTALQEMHLNAITANGGVAMVINEDNVHTLSRWIGLIKNPEE